MLQTIITIIIVIIAVIITMIRVVSFFTSPAGKCKGCSQYDAGCSLEELKGQIKIKKSFRV